MDYLFPEARILIFCKAPAPGRVKTRLAETIGDVPAAKLHAEFAMHCIGMAAHAQLAPVELLCWPSIDDPFFQYCREEFSLELRPQVEGDLGEKMQQAFEAALQNARYAIAMGTDCLVLEKTVLMSALQELRDGTDGVIVPAEDGGYVLLGLSRMQPDVFQDMPWSQKGLMAATRKAMSGHWKEFPPLWDVDRAGDLLRLSSTREEIGVGARLNSLLEEIAFDQRIMR